MALRFQVRGWEGSCQPAPDRVQGYEHKDKAVTHMGAMIAEGCVFADVVDTDKTVWIENDPLPECVACNEAISKKVQWWKQDDGS